MNAAIGRAYPRLSVAQYTSAREVSGIFVALLKFTPEPVDACIRVADFSCGNDEQQVPPLRCAPVGMTILLHNGNYREKSSISNRIVIPTGAQRSGATGLLALFFWEQRWPPDTSGFLAHGEWPRPFIQIPVRTRQSPVHFGGQEYPT